ncbi:transglycosylase domain-containing protein [Leptolyngbya sp. FACHB-261]|uniref:transglycosylase domain-containing protein n=1 Tax=Leptolyngbya sp. FACHB-261 TaxID=2692806 RepID=UPI0016864DA7|nr:transglycosylase domain-containing protein [Leptolyngbya sp. FACHB-261]MBD2103499.1 transglycosylase domain-containing protein [Leptolyngbya sp. FACHB-261]
MSPTPPNRAPKPSPAPAGRGNLGQTLLGTITQVAHKARVNFSKLQLRANARVPELWVEQPGDPSPQVYPLLGERYLLGRSSRTCDIVVRSPVVSQSHLLLERKPGRKRARFAARDQNSTNGLYQGKQRLSQVDLYHGATFSLGPPELANAVTLRYNDPPPWYIQALRYGLMGGGGAFALLVLGVLVGWQGFSVNPLPASKQGPVIVVARDGQTPLRQRIQEVHAENKRVQDFGRVPDAVIASEDSRYYWHLGVDPIGTTRALVTNIRGGGIREGGSTLTQQLARNVLGSYVGKEDSAGRKFREALVALKLEAVYSKQYLLLLYLNRVYLGNGVYGFEDAARFYFNKPASQLDISEAATLAGILPAPNSYNPVDDYNKALELRDGVLWRMRRLGMITPDEYNRARRSRLNINPAAKQAVQGTLAPYFYSYVFDELATLLGDELAQEGNFIVETTVDIQKQKVAETIVRDTVADEGSASGFSQGALVSLEAKTGAIAALVGGVDYQASQFNRANQAQRQPGSTFKVFAYTAALEQGISANTTFSCAPTAGVAGCHHSGGSTDMYQGLAYSENVVAIRIAQAAGLDNVVNVAKRLGIESPLEATPLLSLGVKEVNLLELVGAFDTYANNGVHSRPFGISRILDSSDCQNPQDIKTCRVIYDRAADAGAQQQVLEPSIVNTMTELMRGVVAYGTARRAGLGAVGKTGTTDDNRDLWFVGFIPSGELVTGVWLGNDDNSPTSGSSGQAAQLWGEYTGQVSR